MDCQAERHVPRQGAGLPDPLLRRTLPFLGQPSLHGAAGARSREPAILLVECFM